MKRNKNWKLIKISKDIEEFKLLEVWKQANLKEIKLRKNALKSAAAFKAWYLSLIKSVEYDDKIDIIETEYKKLNNKTDQQKDWLQEKERIFQSFVGEYEGLPTVPDLIIKNQKKVKNFLKNPELAKYKTKIELDYLSGAEHYLNEQNRFLENEIGGINVLDSVYSSLCDELYNDRVYDKHGREYQGVSWNQVLRQADENVRKAAFCSYYSAKRNHRRTLGAIMYNMALRKNQNAKLRKFKHEIEQLAVDYWRISLANYWYIIDQCKKFTKIHIKHRNQHNKLIKSGFDLKEVNPWDEQIEFDNIYKETSMQEVQDLVARSLNSLGADYVNRVRNIYKRDIIQWRDVKPTKTGGSCFSAVDTLDENPIKIKWDGTTKAIFTLSHELGHNLKNAYAKEQNEINYRTDAILSEIPSIVNQTITTLYLLDKYKAEKKPELLYGVYRHLMNAYFHYVNECGFISQYHDTFVHHYIKNEPINPDAIERWYLDDRKDYYGMSATEFNKAKKSPYYCYIKLDAYTTFIDFERRQNNLLAYYIGAIVALPIAYKIYHGDKDMLNKYLKFLKTGNSTKPLNATKVLGIDLTKPQIYTESKQLMNKIINQFIKDIKVK